MYAFEIYGKPDGFGRRVRAYDDVENSREGVMAWAEGELSYSFSLSMYFARTVLVSIILLCRF